MLRFLGVNLQLFVDKKRVVKSNMVYDCSSACAVPDETTSLLFCASHDHIRSCPGSSTFSALDQRARYQAVDNVTNLLRNLPGYSGEHLYNVTGTPCGDVVAAVSCAVSIPVCEAGSHVRKLCNASMCDGLSNGCSSLLDSRQIAAMCSHFSSQVEHTDTGNPDECFGLDYEGPSYVQWVIGFMLCVIFAAMSSLALNLQKSSLNEADKMDEPTPLCKQWKWVLGMCILITGSIVDFVAYGLAPQSVLTPLGGMVLVWNVLISTCFFGEKAGKREWLSTIVIFLGTTVSVIFADHYSPIYTADHIFILYGNPYFVAYCIIIPIFAGGHYILLKYIQKHNLSHPSYPNHAMWQTLECLGYGGTAGTLGSQAILFAKQAMELLKANAVLGDNIWIRWQLYLIILAIPIFLAANITFLNAGLRHYSALQTVPIYQTYWMIIGTISGLIYFKEIDEMSTNAKVFFWIGIITSVIGIVILSGRAPERIMTAQERKAMVRNDLQNASSVPPKSPPLLGHEDDSGSDGGAFSLDGGINDQVDEEDTVSSNFVEATHRADVG